MMNSRWGWGGGQNGYGVGGNGPMPATNQPAPNQPAFVTGQQPVVDGPAPQRTGRQAVVDALMGGNGGPQDYSPVSSPMQGVGRVTGDIVSGMQSNWLAQKKAQAAGGAVPTDMSPAAKYSNPLSYGMGRLGALFGTGG